MDRYQLQAIERERAVERDRLHLAARVRIDGLARRSQRPASWPARLFARVAASYGPRPGGRSQQAGS